MVVGLHGDSDRMYLETVNHEYKLDVVVLFGQITEYAKHMQVLIAWYFISSGAKKIGNDISKVNLFNDSKQL
jgi:hypothetical protein